MFIIKYFHPTLWITKSCCRAAPDCRFEVQNNPTCTNISFSISAPCLGKTEYGEKERRNFYAVTWQSISRDAGQAASQNNHQYQWENPFHAIEQEQFSQQRVDNTALLCHRQSQALRLRQLQLIVQLACQWLLWQLLYQKLQVQFQETQSDSPWISSCSTTRLNSLNLHNWNGYP